jgi:FkbM family methyltransferase
MLPFPSEELHAERTMVGLIAKRISSVPRDVRNVGLPAAAALYASALLAPPRRRPGRGRIGHLRVRGFEHPIHYRHGTSDALVARQIFMKEEYACVSRESDVRFILDCGANIGLSAFYLLSRYPRAELVAIEPDAGNVALARRNLVPFGQRACVIQAGVWSSDAGLKVERGSFKDGNEWSFQVRACRPGEAPDVEALGIQSIMRRRGWDRIDLLKVDVERSELELFSSGCDEWLSRTRNIAIELHGDDCEEAFFAAMKPYRYAKKRFDELTVCRGIEATSAPAPWRSRGEA